MVVGVMVLEEGSVVVEIVLLVLVWAGLVKVPTREPSL